MWRFLVIASVFIFLTSCNSQNNSKRDTDKTYKKRSPPVMHLENKNADFGEVKQGEKVVLFYTFENAGGRDLIIFEAIPSCGCVTLKYDSTPIQPGTKRTVEVTFDSDGWSGVQQKSITFKTNGVPDYASVTLTGTVN